MVALGQEVCPLHKVEEGKEEEVGYSLFQKVGVLGWVVAMVGVLQNLKIKHFLDNIL